MPSSRTEPFDPNTWKLKPGPVAVIVPEIARHAVLHPEQHRRRVVAVHLAPRAGSSGSRPGESARTRSIMPSMACTPIGVSAPHGVSSLSARHASGFRNKPFGNVIVASTWRIVPSSPLSGSARAAWSSRDGSGGCSRAPASRRPACVAATAASRLGLRQRERLLAEHVLAGLAPPRSPAGCAASAASPAPPRRRSGSASSAS